MKEHGPGMRWLARRTGKDIDDLASSPRAALSALGDAVREVADLAARSGSADPQVRAQAQAEAAELGKQFESGPTPSEVLLRRTAAALHEAADRLERDDSDPR